MEINTITFHLYRTFTSFFAHHIDHTSCSILNTHTAPGADGLQTETGGGEEARKSATGGNAGTRVEVLRVDIQV